MKHTGRLKNIVHLIDCEEVRELVYAEAAAPTLFDLVEVAQ